MYFINDEHQYNYERFMSHYGLGQGVNGQYESQIYIAAIPDIFKCFDQIEKIDVNDGGPLYLLADWSEEKETFSLSHPALTGATTRLTEVGLSLYNGHPIGLDDVFGSVVQEDLLKALFQAMKIRGGIEW